MRHKEEVKGTVNDFRLLDEAVVHVSALRRVGDGVVAALVVVMVASSAVVALLATELEEALSDSLVDDDESGLGKFALVLLRLVVVLLLHNLVELLQLVLDHLRTHRVAHSISVDEDVVGQLALVVVSERLESVLEVLLKDGG